MNQLRSWLYGHGSESKLKRHTKPEDSKQETDDGEELPKNSLKNLVLNVIPLAPGDCLECKLIGSGVMALSGIIVGTSALTASSRSNKIPMHGPMKTLYYALCGGLFLAFESAAVYRLFDLGPFSKSAAETMSR